MQYGDVHLFGTSGYRESGGISNDSMQGRCIKKIMAVSNANWKIGFGNYPPYSSRENGGYQRLKWPLKEFGATAVLSGHDHKYERLDIKSISYFVNGLSR